MTSPNTSKREKIGNIHGVDIISDPSYKSDEIGIAYPPNTSSEVDLELAKKFHETYERLAPDFGYETRDDTKQFDPQSKNGKLMVAVCHEINKDFHQSEIKGRIDELEKALLNVSCFNPEVVKNRIEYLNQMKGKV